MYDKCFLVFLCEHITAEHTTATHIKVFHSPVSLSVANQLKHETYRQIIFIIKTQRYKQKQTAIPNIFTLVTDDDDIQVKFPVGKFESSSSLIVI